MASLLKLFHMATLHKCYTLGVEFYFFLKYLQLNDIPQVRHADWAEESLLHFFSHDYHFLLKCQSSTLTTTHHVTQSLNRCKCGFSKVFPRVEGVLDFFDILLVIFGLSQQPDVFLLFRSALLELDWKLLRHNKRNDLRTQEKQ